MGYLGFDANKNHEALATITRCQGFTDQERATGLEPATSSLGSWHSTN
jgi:hypothetical protein